MMNIPIISRVLTIPGGVGFLPSTVIMLVSGRVGGFLWLEPPKKVFQNPASIAGSSSGAKPCGKRPSSEGAMVGWELEDGLKIRE